MFLPTERTQLNAGLGRHLFTASGIEPDKSHSEGQSLICDQAQSRKQGLDRSGESIQAARLPTMRSGGWDPLALTQTPVRNHDKIRGQSAGRSPGPRVTRGTLYPLLLYHLW